jgi:membrane-associated protease RseP (regulator of RpoE activity)
LFGGNFGSTGDGSADVFGFVPPAANNSPADLGFTVANSTDGNGVVVTHVDAGSDAAEKGIDVGDIIAEVNQTEVNDTDEFAEAVADAESVGRTTLLLLVNDDGNISFVSVPLGTSTGNEEDTIGDFEDGIDTILISGSSFADLSIAQVGGNVVIDFNDESIRLAGEVVAKIDENDFAFI